MKYLLPILLFISFITKMNAQSIFAPIGATWTYKCWSSFGDGPACLCKSIGDTVIQSKQCKVLQLDCVYMYRCGIQYLYSDSGKVYFWDTDRNIFQMLFNINANVGNTFSLMPKYPSNDSIVYVVDSTSTININGNILKKLSVHVSHKPNNINAESNKFIENIGNSGYMFPWTYTSNAESYEGPLACYTDPILGFYDFGVLTNCSTSSINEPVGNDFSVFPNPNNGRFTISIDGRNTTMMIYNILGESIQEVTYMGKHQNIIFDLPDGSKGIYIVKIKSENELITRKIIVE